MTAARKSFVLLHFFSFERNEYVSFRLRAGDSVLLCFFFKLPRVFLHYCLEGASFVHGGFSHCFCEKDPFVNVFEKDPFVTPKDVVRTDWGLFMTVIPFLSFLQGSFAPMGNGRGGKKS